MRVVCDTNVLVRAALNSSGLAAVLLRQIRVSHTLITSRPLLSELLDVLRRPKIRQLHGRDEDGIRRFVSSVYKVATVVALPHPMPRLIPQDPKDDPVLMTAIGGKADILTTRDQHFFHADVLAVASSFGVRIVGDDQLLAEWQAAL